MPESSQYRRNVAVVAFKGNDILLVHKPRKNDAWQFPQGGIDEGEAEHEAAVREFQEETGKNPIQIVKKSNETYRYEFPSGYTRFDGTPEEFVGQEQSFWLVRFDGDKRDVELCPKELDKYEWIDPKELDHYIVRPEYLEMCRRVLKEFKLLT